MCVERERDVEIECVQNDRNVFMSIQSCLKFMRAIGENA